jgi:hypothetical protein
MLHADKNRAAYRAYYRGDQEHPDVHCLLHELADLVSDLRSAFSKPKDVVAADGPRGIRLYVSYDIFWRDLSVGFANSLGIAPNSDGIRQALYNPRNLEMRRDASSL